jgi:putative transposase
MPDHFHLLISEPEVGDPSVVMKVIKERFSKQIHALEENRLTHADQDGSERIWQKRFYDFNVWSAQKQTEKIKYMHRNPVKRGLVERPEHWPWSSFRGYLYGETGPVRVRFQEWKLEIKPRPVQNFARVDNPLNRTERE